jgi:hypothetical protein
MVRSSQPLKSTLSRVVSFPNEEGRASIDSQLNKSNDLRYESSQIAAGKASRWVQQNISSVSSRENLTKRAEGNSLLKPL